MLTLDRNYSSLVCSNPGPDRYPTPWRIPVICGGKQRNQSALLEGRLVDKKKSSSSKNWDYEHNPLESREVGSFYLRSQQRWPQQLLLLPEISTEEGYGHGRKEKSTRHTNTRETLLILQI